MEMNKGITVFVVQDWMGKELGRFTTLDGAEEFMTAIVSNDEQVKALVDEMERLEDAGAGAYELEMVELEMEEVETGIREDLYVYGYDKNGNEMPVEFG